MDLDGLGARCALSSCNTLDYLPLTCGFCSKSFCSTHFPPTSHACPYPPHSKHIPSCPLCSRAIRPTAQHPDVGHAMAHHIDRGCPARRRDNPRCAHDGCRARDVAPVRCRACGDIFCIEHRLEADHDCVGSIAAPGFSKEKAGKGRSMRGMLTGRSRSASRDKGEKKHAKRMDAFANLPENPKGVFGDDEDIVRVAVYFSDAVGKRPEFWVVNRRHSAGKVLDSFRLPQLQNRERFGLYAVRVAGGRAVQVNLLPRIVPLREHIPMLLSSGDALVVEIGEGGLGEEWTDALRVDKGLAKFATRIGERSSASRDTCTLV